MTRKFSSTSKETTLIGAGASSTATTITVATGGGDDIMGGESVSGGDQFTVALSPDTTNEEIVFVTARAGDTLTISRGQSGTGTPGVSGVAHAAGATVKHVLTSDDLDYFTAGVDASITSASTSTLTNKTVSLASNTVTGNLAQFNTALTDANFATLVGAETLENKTLTTPVLSFPVSSVAINSQTSAYTLTATDKSKMVIVTSASTANVTVPPSVFSQGDVVYISRSGAGTLSLTQGAGVTITGTPGLALRAQASVAAILCTGTNTFIATGDLSA